MARKGKRGKGRVHLFNIVIVQGKNTVRDKIRCNTKPLDGV
jgi:hypothetical protein